MKEGIEPMQQSWLGWIEYPFWLSGGMNMISLRESSIFKTNATRFTERKSIVGAFSSFEKDIYRDKFWMPHEEMAQCIEMYNRNSFAQSAVNTMKDFIKGGDIVVKSEHEESAEKAQKFLDKLQTDWWVDEVIENSIKTGNSYLEVDWANQEWTVPERCYAIADSSRIYLYANEFGEPFLQKKLTYDPLTKEPRLEEVKNEEEFYIQRIDAGFKHPRAKWYDMSYHAGFLFRKFRVYGIPIHMRKMIHFKLNIGDTGIYGRSYLASALDDYEILKQIERSLAIIAKYKAVPRDIIAYGDKDNPATNDEVDEFILYMESLEKDESAIVNKPIKRESLAYAGQDINLDYMIQHVRKKIIAGIAPDFMMGIGQDINRATAQISLISYILSIYAKRKLFLKPIEHYFLEPFCEREGIEPCWLEFGELDFETKSEKTNRVGALWTQNLLTFNEARNMLGLHSQEEGDKYYLEWQSKMSQNMFPAFGGGEGQELPQPGGAMASELPGNEEEEAQPQPVETLPNNEPLNKVFSHNEPVNKTPVAKGGKLPYDPYSSPAKKPKFVPQAKSFTASLMKKKGEKK